MKKNQASKNSLLNVPNVSEISVENLQLATPFKLISIRNLYHETFVLRFDKNNMKFNAGQHITLGVAGDNQTREYSIYSAEHKPYLEVLLKEIENGMVSKKLHECVPGDFLNVEGPFGFFTLEKEKMDRKHLFIATGTGIAPFHCMAGTYPDLNYEILHGVRYYDEGYDKNFYPEEKYILCTSRDHKGKFKGRVTDYLVKHPVNFDTLIYLCGNSDMIYDVYDILMSQHFPANQIKTEVYF